MNIDLGKAELGFNLSMKLVIPLVSQLLLEFRYKINCMPFFILTHYDWLQNTREYAESRDRH